MRLRRYAARARGTLRRRRSSDALGLMGATAGACGDCVGAWVCSGASAALGLAVESRTPLDVLDNLLWMACVFPPSDPRASVVATVAAVVQLGHRRSWSAAAMAAAMVLGSSWLSVAAAVLSVARV